MRLSERIVILGFPEIIRPCFPHGHRRCDWRNQWPTTNQLVIITSFLTRVFTVDFSPVKEKRKIRILKEKNIRGEYLRTSILHKQIREIATDMRQGLDSQQASTMMLPPSD